MAILWDRNYCVKFLDIMISYYGKSENILAFRLMMLRSSVEIIAVSWIWSIMYIVIVMPRSWLEACTHKMKECGWG